MDIKIIPLLMFGFALVACTPNASQQDSNRLAVADDMVDAWNQMDWDRVFDLFAEDGVLHSMMVDPVVGRPDISQRLSALVDGLERIELQILNRGVVDDVVVLERVDDFVYKGKHSRVPVVGVMEISDGKIDEWREYYDKATLLAALTPSAPAHSSNDAKAEIDRLTKQLSTDWNRGDMDAYLDAYLQDESTSLTFGNTLVSSSEQMNGLFRSSWTTQEQMGNFTTDQVNVRMLGSELAIARGLFEHRFPTETIHGAFSHVWQRVDGAQWKIVHEHTSRGHVEEASKPN